jgi:hypothetical protein
MQFNEHQNRLWRTMINLIEDFRKGQISYTNLVYRLEGALDAGEFKDRVMIDKWYDYWTPLEILSATKHDSTRIEDINEDLSEMEIFLKRQSGFSNQEDEE